MACEHCGIRKAIILRPKNKMKVCKECFYDLFEQEIHSLIVDTKMFDRGSRVGIGISGGKDSTVLAYILNKLNIKHNYGLNLVLLCVDEGISGYRDRSIDTVHENQRILGLELKIVSYDEIFGMTMDQIVGKIGKKGNCTYCGILRRQSLEDAARKMDVDYIVTGHNADDLAETILLNFFRGDISRLRRCTLSKTKEQIAPESTNDAKELISSQDERKSLEECYNRQSCCNNEIKTLEESSNEQSCCNNEIYSDKSACCKDEINPEKSICCNDENSKKNNSESSKFLSLSRCKPFKYSYQKEIVFYAYFKKLPYFSTECTYAPGASRGDFRTLIKDLEKVDSEVILKIIKSGEQFLDDSTTYLKIKECVKCSHPTSSPDQVCNACGMIEKLRDMKSTPCCPE